MEQNVDEPVVVKDTDESEERPLYLIVWKKDPSWDSWYTLSTQAQTDLDTVKEQAEAHKESYIEGGWTDVIVKVASITII